ncbi:hypothetical protein Ssi03_68020 [Sphaerisporangium siamense]|uniref:O-antigen/teichoic acid export membrane protein n=1 Tax=Sphaerisporangium siamense TaxID=795645 RepID=A0A7W7D7G7_9ACTN|nr:polysaccharide biosynthesis C-terminal domain-containing protein [Sphaerisporangium siamense]MBB4700760.1 O-antigen/teichoic acid export membrane protein [Sphaerisporangium siamense]GII88812.1 hypothetical protein Ssi03_68020 [Sphaerisporangium siamense]
MSSSDGRAVASLVRGGAAGLAGAVAGAAAQMLIVVALTRGLDAASAGTVLTATSLCLMAAGVLRLDTGNGLIYFIARHRDGAHPDISRLVRSALLPVLVLSVAAATLAYIGADTVVAALNHGSGSGWSPSPPTGTSTGGTGTVAVAASLVTADATATVVRTLAVALPFVVCADILLAATRGFGAMRPTILLGGVLQPGGQLVLVGALLAAGAAPAWAIPAAWAAPYLPVVLLAALWLRRRVPPPGGTPNVTPRFWRYTAPRAFGAATQAVFQRLDVVIVAALAGPAEAAVYTAATRFKVVGQLANQGLTQAVQPRLVRALADGDLPLARVLYQATTMWLVVLTWPIWLGYALLAPWLLRVFGEGYEGGAAVAVVLAVTMMAATACGMVDVVLIAAGHTVSSTLNMLTAIVVTVALDVVLVPAYGTLGAALGWSAGVLVKNALPLVRVSRRYGLHPFGRHSLPSLRLPPSLPALRPSPEPAPTSGRSAGRVTS